MFFAHIFFSFLWNICFRNFNRSFANFFRFTDGLGLVIPLVTQRSMFIVDLPTDSTTQLDLVTRLRSELDLVVQR